MNVLINYQPAFRLSEFRKVASTGYQSDHMRLDMFFLNCCRLFRLYAEPFSNLRPAVPPFGALVGIQLNAGNVGLAPIMGRSPYLR
jgi:hypothetical protein